MKIVRGIRKSSAHQRDFGVRKRNAKKVVFALNYFETINKNNKESKRLRVLTLDCMNVR